MVEDLAEQLCYQHTQRAAMKARTGQRRYHLDQHDRNIHGAQIIGVKARLEPPTFRGTRWRVQRQRRQGIAINQHYRHIIAHTAVAGACRQRAAQTFQA